MAAMVMKPVLKASRTMQVLAAFDSIDTRSRNDISFVQRFYHVLRTESQEALRVSVGVICN
jgi:hypothetical protein